MTAHTSPFGGGGGGGAGGCWPGGCRGALVARVRGPLRTLGCPPPARRGRQGRPTGLNPEGPSPHPDLVLCEGPPFRAALAPGAFGLPLSASVTLYPPSVSLHPPSVNPQPPSVNPQPPSGDLHPPSVNPEPPSVDLQPPSVSLETPSVNLPPPWVTLQLVAACARRQRDCLELGRCRLECSCGSGGRSVILGAA